MPFETEMSPGVVARSRETPDSFGPVTAAGDTTVKGAQSGFVFRFYRIYLGNNGGASVIVRLQESFSAVNAVEAPLAANGGGVILDFGPEGWTLSGVIGLDINLPAGGPFDVFINFLEWERI